MRGQRPGGDGVAAGFGGRADGRDTPATEGKAAQTLCTAATVKNITCSLHTLDGRHSWQFASSAFKQALPWLSTRLDVPTGSGTASTDLK
jgi:S-formylglutathione hydrolase FrmB